MTLVRHESVCVLDCPHGSTLFLVDYENLVNDVEEFRNEGLTCEQCSKEKGHKVKHYDLQLGGAGQILKEVP